jgi:hypothetical protein
VSTQTLPGEGLYRKLMGERAEQRGAIAEAKQRLRDLGLRLPPDHDLEHSVYPTREFRVVNVRSRHTLLKPATFAQLAMWCRERTGGSVQKEANNKAA